MNINIMMDFLALFLLVLLVGSYLIVLGFAIFDKPKKPEVETPPKTETDLAMLGLSQQIERYMYTSDQGIGIVNCQCGTCVTNREEERIQVDMDQFSENFKELRKKSKKKKAKKIGMKKEYSFKGAKRGAVVKKKPRKK